MVIQRQQAGIVVSERRFVPIFPKFAKDGGFSHFSALTEDFLQERVTHVLRRAFPEMAPIPPTPHSLRVVALIWALRCMLQQHRSKLCGRWFGENNKSWAKYARAGEDFVEQYYRKGKLDPVLRFWRFTDNYVGEIP
jgi:hypothetical protein